MLKIVNAPAFGLANTISSVHQATVLLGIKSVVNIINGISIRGQLSDEDIVGLNNFWDTSMDIAVVSQNVARQIGLQETDNAYCLGLFHNTGIVLMKQRFPTYMDILQQAYAHNTERVIDLENHHFSTNHAVIGYYTARSCLVVLRRVLGMDQGGHRASYSSRGVGTLSLVLMYHAAVGV